MIEEVIENEEVRDDVRVPRAIEVLDPHAAMVVI
jgi:hypothetical protein